MITKEAIEAGVAAFESAFNGSPNSTEMVTTILTAAFAAMPGPAVKLDRLRAILRELWAACDMDLKMCDGTIKTGQFGILQDIREDIGLLLSTVALTHAPDLASENERLRAALDGLRKDMNRCEHDGGYDREIGPIGCHLGDKCVCMPLYMKINAALERT